MWTFRELCLRLLIFAVAAFSAGLVCYYGYVLVLQLYINIVIIFLYKFL